MLSVAVLIRQLSGNGRNAGLGSKSFQCVGLFGGGLSAKQSPWKQGSFCRHFPESGKLTKIIPRRIGNPCAGAAKWASGKLSGARWAPGGRQGRSEADFGRLLGALGALLAALGPVLGLLGPLLGSLGALPGVMLASRGGSFWSFLGLFFRRL